MNLPREILWLPLILAQVAAFDRWNSTAYNLKIGPAVRTMEMAGYQFTQGARVGSWILRIMKGNDFACGASYISALYALTSANCMHIYRSELSALKVEFVMPDQDDQERSFALVSSVYVPGQWQYGDTYMDVAVIKLSNSLRGNLEDFVRLCRKPLSDHARVEVVACGGHPDADVRVESIRVLDRSDCDGEYGNFALRETVSCGKEFARTEDCMFAPGCPVSSGAELCGIVAWGPPTCQKKLPGIFTDLYQARHFIKKVISGHDRRRNRKQHKYGLYSLPQW